MWPPSSHRPLPHSGSVSSSGMAPPLPPSSSSHSGRPLPPHPTSASQQGSHPPAYYGNQAYDLHHVQHAYVVPCGPSSSHSSNSNSSSGTLNHSHESQNHSQTQPRRMNQGMNPTSSSSPSSNRHNHHHNTGKSGSGSGRNSSKKRVFADPAEMVVIDYVDGAHVSPRRPLTAQPQVATSNPVLKPPIYRHPPPQPVTKPLSKMPVDQKPKPVNLHNDILPSGEMNITAGSGTGSRTGTVLEGFYQTSSGHYHHEQQQQQQQHHHQMFHHHHHHQLLVESGYHHAQQHQMQSNEFYGSLHHSNHIHGSSGHHSYQPNHQMLTKSSNRSSRSSDTSSAYSGSDTMQSMHSSLENEPVDLSGLHESVVDSDEELADSMDSLAIRDVVRDCLEKDPADRTAEDIDVLLEFSQQLPAFCNMTLATRRALCSVMVFAVVEKAGTIVMNSGEELDSWSVIINGEVRIDCDDPGATNPCPHGSSSSSDIHGYSRVGPRFLKWGDSFGITPTMEKLYHQGVMRTCLDDCQFVCITQNDYYKILNEELTNQRRYEEDGKTVLVTEPDPNGKIGHKVIRGTPERLLSQLIDENSTTDPTFVEDFLLTHRTFMKNSWKVADQLLEWFNEGKLCDRVTRVLLLWVHNHFTDFEMDPEMMEFLERFEKVLEAKKMNGQLRMLNFTCAEKARRRTVTLLRPSRDEELQFSLMGGYERGFGIFVDKVEKNSKAAEIGLKRGDQILEVNRLSFEHNMKLQRAISFLKENTHLEMCVKSNLLVFKEMLQMPENSPRSRMKKASDSAGLRGTSSEYDFSKRGSSKTLPSSHSLTLTNHRSSSSILPVTAMSGKEKVKAMLKNLIKTRPSSITTAVLGSDSDLSGMIGTSVDCDPWEFSSDVPEHSLKIFKSDQNFKFLLVHQNTSAREVVMLALQEFGISECSSNFTLCEVTVEGGFVRQKRLPNDQTNLAERIGLTSRYYIKNILNSEQLILEDAKNELTKESCVNLLQLNAIEAAMQLMVEDFTCFRTVEPTEYIDKLFELDSKFGVPNLTRFGELVNTEMMWVITEIVSEPIVGKRSKIIKQFIKIAYHCYKDTQNYNSMFAITSGLDHGSVKRLRASWEKVSAKYLKLLSEMSNIMDPSMNFRKYRNLLSNAKPPFIPIYPMVSKDLTFIHLGNETKIENLINFEKLRMLAKEIRSLTSMCSAPLNMINIDSDLSKKFLNLNPPTHGAGVTMKRPIAHKKNKEALNARKMYEEAQMVRRVKAYLSKINVIKDEEVLLKMSLEIEPPPASSHHQTTPGQQQSQEKTSSGRTISAQSSTASIGSKPKRGHSPTPSMGSTASSTSHQSEGRKSTTSGTKFGTDSPQAVRKLMSLSEAPKTRRAKSKPSVSSLHSNSSPKTSPNLPRRNQNNNINNHNHVRSTSDVRDGKVSLSKESSSVTSLQALKKDQQQMAAVISRHHPSSQDTKSVISIPKAKLGGRTLSRERKNKKEDKSDERISAV